MPSMSPRAEAGAPSVTVRKVGSSAVGISWPASEKKLAMPMARAPGVSHLAWPAVVVAVGSGSSVTRSV